MIVGPGLIEVCVYWAAARLDDALSSWTRLTASPAKCGSGSPRFVEPLRADLIDVAVELDRAKRHHALIILCHREPEGGSGELLRQTFDTLLAQDVIRCLQQVRCKFHFVSLSTPSPDLTRLRALAWTWSAQAPAFAWSCASMNALRNSMGAETPAMGACGSPAPAMTRVPKSNIRPRIS